MSHHIRPGRKSIRGSTVVATPLLVIMLIALLISTPGMLLAQDELDTPTTDVLDESTVPTDEPLGDTDSTVTIPEESPPIDDQSSDEPPATDTETEPEWDAGSDATDESAIAPDPTLENLASPEALPAEAALPLIWVEAGASCSSFDVVDGWLQISITDAPATISRVLALPTGSLLSDVAATPEVESVTPVPARVELDRELPVLVAAGDAPIWYWSVTATTDLPLVTPEILLVQVVELYGEDNANALAQSGDTGWFVIPVTADETQCESVPDVPEVSELPEEPTATPTSPPVIEEEQAPLIPVTVALVNDSASGGRGSTVIFQYQIENLNDRAVDVDLAAALDIPSWHVSLVAFGAELAPGPITLAPFEVADIEVHLTIPLNAGLRDQNRVRLNVSTPRLASAPSHRSTAGDGTAGSEPAMDPNELSTGDGTGVSALATSDTEAVEPADEEREG